MEKVLEPDPHYVETRNREIEANPDGSQLNGPIASGHLWKTQFPAGLSLGNYLIEVEATDAYGRMHKGNRIIRVR
jgi:hypothetical protein